MLAIPDISWEADPAALYTVLLEDNGVTLFPGFKIMHYLVQNVRGKVSDVL